MGTNAEPDEPVFVLRGRDKLAPAAVEHWALRREMEILRKRSPVTDLDAVKEALACAAAMRDWRLKNRSA